MVVTIPECKHEGYIEVMEVVRLVNEAVAKAKAEVRERERAAFNAGCLYGWDHGYGRNETCTDGEAEALRRYPKEEKA